jgi:hypothetical protein
MAIGHEEEPLAITFAKEVAGTLDQAGTVIVTSALGTIEKIIRIEPPESKKEQ